VLPQSPNPPKDGGLANGNNVANVEVGTGRLMIKKTGKVLRLPVLAYIIEHMS
jgi:hypothetical protein